MWDSVCLFTTLALSQLSERGSKNCKTVRNPLKKMFPQLKRKSYILLRQIGQDKISYFIITNRTGISSWSNKYWNMTEWNFIFYCDKYDRMKSHIVATNMTGWNFIFYCDKYDRMKTHIVATNMTGWNLIFYCDK